MDEGTGDNEIKNIPEVAPGVVKDSKAQREETAILAHDYEDDGRRADHRRQQGVKQVAYYVLCAGVVVGVLAITAIAGVWLWHILTPWRWLSPDEIDHVQSILLSGALSAAITLLGSKVIKI